MEEPGERIEESGYALTPIRLVNVSAFLIHRPGKAILVDCGNRGSEDKILETLEKLGLGYGDLKLLVLTHGHFDHAGAAAKLKELGYRNVFVKAGDGYFGWPEKAPFDAIIGTAAAGRIPQPLLDQLKPGGRMILPLRGRLGYEYLEVVTKDKNGRIERKKVMPVRFVPMTGQVQKPEKDSDAE